MSLKMAREHLLFALDDNLITDEENRSSNLDLPYNEYTPFNLVEMKDDECLAEFRVRKTDIPLLVEALGIPNKFVCGQRSVVADTEALCMLLKRLTYPCRYSDMMQRFGQRPVPVLCMATNCVLDFIYDIHHRKNYRVERLF